MSDLRKRIKQHKDGLVKSTCKRMPLELIHYESYLLETDARRREKFLKKTEGKRLLKQQLRDVLKLNKGDKASGFTKKIKKQLIVNC